MKKRWTNEETDFFIQNYGKTSVTDLSNKMNRPITSLHQKAKALKLSFFEQKKQSLTLEEKVDSIFEILKDIKYVLFNYVELGTWTPEQHDFLKQNYNKLSISELEKKLNKRRSTIYNYASKLGYTRTKSKLNPLSLQQTKDLIDMWNNGFTAKEIANSLSKKTGDISAILFRLRSKGKIKRKYKKNGQTPTS